jgi:hypothetical protein
MGFLRNSLWFGAGRACVWMNNWTGFACCRCDPPDCIKTLGKSWIPSIYVHIYIYIYIYVYIYVYVYSYIAGVWASPPGAETLVPAMIWTTEQGLHQAPLGTFQQLFAGDPLGTLQRFLRILSNRWKTQHWLMQGPSRDPPGILQGPLPRDLSMDADRLPVGMVAFGSVACRTGCLWLGSMYYRNTISHIYTYIYIYICIYVST